MTSSHALRALAALAILLLAAGCGRELPIAPPSQSSAGHSASDTLGGDARFAPALPGDGNVAPIVEIVWPPLWTALDFLTYPTRFRVRWEGVDPDGPNRRPAYYKYRLFLCSDSDIPCNLIAMDPDTLNRRYGPRFAGWDSVGGDVSEVVLSNLQPRGYIFAITAFDANGAHDSLFSTRKNLLRFSASSTMGPPSLTVESVLFRYAKLPGFSPDTSPDLLVEMPEGSLDFHWSAQTYPNDLAGYRWALDPVSLDASGPTRTGDDRRDLQHWTDISLANTSATIGPFNGNAARQDHWLFIEAWEEFDHRTRLVVRLHPVRTDFESDLLIVNDTRLAADELLPNGALRPPSGQWPTAAELDTFLFARGGVPWRGYPGMLSAPGLFSSYAFDTIGTGREGLDFSVPLELLSRYRNVVWIVDPEGAFHAGFAPNPWGMNALRYMSAPGRVNALASYARQGGNLWVLGGGIATSNLLWWNYGGNDIGRIVFCEGSGELTPERFVYNACGWQSCVDAIKRPVAFARASGAPRELPQRLELRSPATDPLPPYRSAAQFWLTSTSFEYIAAPNVVMGDGNPSPKHLRPIEALDSLYTAVGVTLPEPPDIPTAMTVFRTPGGGRVVMSGFDIWSWRRSDCQALVDGVLGEMWGLPRRRRGPSARR